MDGRIGLCNMAVHIIEVSVDIRILGGTVRRQMESNMNTALPGETTSSQTRIKRAMTG